MTVTYEINQLSKTKQLAEVLAQIAEPNLFILLNGPLGVGKTQLTKLIGEALGINEVIVSPTFVILNQYQTNNNWSLVHVDAYRLSKLNNELQSYWELMADNFTIIEWADNLKHQWNDAKTISIKLTIDSNEQRTATIITNNLTHTAEKKLVKISFK